LPQVAAPLAATLVAFDTFDAAGHRLIGERLLNAVLVLMLTTSILGPVLTERFAPRMIPHDRVKNERPHEVPLSDAAMAVMKTVNRVRSRNDFVFTTTGVSAASGFSRAKRRLDEKIKELKGEPLEHWTFHDLRRTAATGLEKLHFPLPVTEAVLNHIFRRWIFRHLPKA
jgi:integrase